MKLEAKTEKEMREANVPWPKTEEELLEYIRSCLAAVNAPADGDHEAMGDAYGRCVYAMSMAAVAAFQYVAHVEGVTGFQASCADMDVLRRTRGLKGPFSIVDYSKMLYPQYDVVADVTKMATSEDTKAYLKKEATKLLDEKTEFTHPEVVNHWKKLAAWEGVAPDGKKE